MYLGFESSGFNHYTCKNLSIPTTLAKLCQRLYTYRDQSQSWQLRDTVTYHPVLDAELRLTLDMFLSIDVC